ncbi:2'-5' RNA ligase family protein [Planosporangium sp. 12N6]|uniref:2'-5' RNA ligase family protein n=1 Tax=Planosporangium spinosum TaxID=3402278 RepID=UPI003CEA43F4
MTSTFEYVDQLRDHWWWRPGWRAERHFYACHFTFDDQPDLQRLVAEYQDPLREIRGLDLIPARWLHLTMQGIGFVDEVEANHVAALAAAAAEKLATVPAPVVTFHRPVIRSEAVYLPAQPADGVHAVRSAVREAISEVLGESGLEGTQSVSGYRPHVSLAYSNADQPAAPILDALSQVDPEPVTITLRHVDLLEFHRDRRMYEWVSAQPLTIGAAF